jgi:2-keto-3-deoxy-L-rhamnonate aldolase RhmA
MILMADNTTSFRKRLRSGEPLIGTFVKTPSSIIADVLGYTDLDVF